MTIEKADINLLKSERLNDDADGGGFMTGQTINDGVENNLFPDVSELDRATGAVDYRKFYAAVLSPTQDVYYGAHMIVDVAPNDPAVHALLTSSSGIAERRSDLITRLNTAGTDAVFYGIKPLSVDALLAYRSVKVDSLKSVFIPPATLGGFVSGPIQPQQDDVRRSRPAVLTSQDTSVTVVGQGTVFYTWPELGTISGLYRTSYLSEVDGVEVLTRPGGEGAVNFTGPGFYAGVSYDTNSALTGNYTGQYTPVLEAPLERVTQTFTYTSGGGSARSFTLDDPSADASESVEWVDAASQPHSLVNTGPETFVSNSAGTARVDRAHGYVLVDFAIPPANGSTVTVRYARRSDALELNDPAAPGSDGGRAISLEPGYSLQEAHFDFAGYPCKVVAPDFAVRRQVIDLTESLPRLVDGVTVGYYDPGTAKLFLVGIGTLANWIGLQIIPYASTATGTAINATIQAGLEPQTVVVTGTKADNSAFSVAADVDGYFSGFATGRYLTETGALSLTTSAAVKYAGLAFEGSKSVFSVVGESIAGVDPTKFASDGRVAIFREGDVVVVHNTQALAPLTVANAQVVDLTRPRVSDARVFGFDGAEIFDGFTLNRTEGELTFTDVAGYAQPVTITHRVEDLASVQTVSDNGAITLSRPLTHDYPAGESYISSALVLGDLQGRALAGFQQGTWTGVWSDSPIGESTDADYNEAVYPIAATDEGAITERWLVRFTGSTSFVVVGEAVGQIATGNTVTTCAPINPATGVPYFSINPLGWGSGWAVGNAYRFNTLGGSAPAWAIRPIAPSDPYVGQDKLSIALRGSVDA